jgi:hypothetical protein
MEGSFTGVGRAASGLNPVLAKVTADTLPVQSAFRALGLTSSQSLDEAKARIAKAYEVIRTSGTTSTADLFRAHAAYEAKLKDLATKATPDLVLAQNKAAFSLKGFAATLQQAGLSSGALGTAMSLLVNPITIAGAAATALALSVKSATDALVQNAEQVKQMMAVSGLGAEAADNLGNTLKILGIDANAVTTAMFRLGAEIDTGGAGLRRLGISITDATGNAKTEGALFREVRDRISEIGSASTRSALLIDLFGRSGRELAALMAMSREEFQKWMETAAVLSPWSAQAQRDTEALMRAQHQLGLEWDALKIKLGLELLPLLRDLLRVMNDVIATDPGPSQIPSFLDRITQQATSAIGEFSILYELFKRFSDLPIPGLGGIPGGQKRDEILEREREEFRARSIATRLPTVEVTAQRPLRQDEIRKLLLEVEGRRQEVFDSLTIMGALVAQQAQLGLKSDSDLLRAQLAHLHERQAAEENYYNEMAGLIDRNAIKDDQSGTERLKLTQARLKMRADTEAKAIDLEAQIAVTLERETSQITANLEAWRQLGDAEEAAAIAAQRFGLMVDEYVGGRVREIEGMLTTVQAQALIGEKTELDLLEAQLKAVRERAKVEQEALEARQFYLEETKGELDPSVEIARIQTEQKIADIRAKAGRDELMIAAQIDQARRAELERRTSALAGWARFGVDDTLRQIQAFEAPMLQLKESISAIDMQWRFFGKDIDRSALDLQAVRTAMEGLINRRAQLEQEVERTEDLSGLLDQIDRVDAQLDELHLRFKELKRVEDIKDFVRGVFASIDSGIADTIRGVLQGTQTLQDALNRMVENIGISIVEGLMKRALKPLEDELIKIIELLARAGLQWWSGLSTPTDTSGSGGSGFGAAGGIFDRPTRMIIGEAGPEAVIPLAKLGGAGVAAALLAGRTPAVAPGPNISMVGEAGPAAAALIARATGSVAPAGPTLGMLGAAGLMASALMARMPRLAAGGVVTRPTVAMVGEAGPEAVVPLDRAGSLVDRAIDFTPLLVGLRGLEVALYSMPARIGWNDASGAGPGDHGTLSVYVENTVEIVDQRQSGSIQRQEGWGPDGRKVIRMLVRDEVNAMGNDGGIDRMLGMNFGVTRRGVSR